MDKYVMGCIKQYLDDPTSVNAYAIFHRGMCGQDDKFYKKFDLNKREWLGKYYWIYWKNGLSERLTNPWSEGKALRHWPNMNPITEKDIAFMKSLLTPKDEFLEADENKIYVSS